MIKLYRYELKHYLTDKVFIILTVITGVYSWFTLTSDTILGVANTAPFSPWSFGGYLASVLPFCLACLLALIATMHSADAKLTEEITAATPMDGRRRVLLCLGAVYTGFILLLILVVAMALVFYYRIFGVINVGSLFAPLAFAVIPGLLVVTGAAMNMGRLNSGGIYALMALLMLYGLVSGGSVLPGALDLFGGGFFRSFPKIIDGVDPVFSVPADMLLSRLVLTLLGLIGMGAAVRAFGKAKRA